MQPARATLMWRHATLWQTSQCMHVQQVRAFTLCSSTASFHNRRSLPIPRMPLQKVWYPAQVFCLCLHEHAQELFRRLNDAAFRWWRQSWKPGAIPLGKVRLPTGSAALSLMCADTDAAIKKLAVMPVIAARLSVTICMSLLA